jgi:uncharacterized membrane protein
VLETDENINTNDNDNDNGSKSESLIKSLRRDFFYGLILILPTVATIILVIFFVNLISGPISSLFGKKIPLIVNFLITISLITITGIAARNFIGAAILKFAEDLIKRIPIINKIYKSTKQIVNAFSFKDKNLLGAILVEYPKKGTWALGFLTKDDASGLMSKDKKNITEGMCAVFVPTTPNPTSGYLIYVNRKEIRELDISVEDSIKVLMSAGVVTPGSDFSSAKKRH